MSVFDRMFCSNCPKSSLFLTIPQNTFVKSGFSLDIKTMSIIEYLLYVSQILEKEDPQSLRGTLLQKSFIHSNMKETTGVLYYRNGFFLHYIEGPTNSFQNLAREFRTSGAHYNFRILSHGKIESRLFKDWSIQWVAEEKQGPSSESLIDLFETALPPNSASPNELGAVLRRFGKYAEPFPANHQLDSVKSAH